MNKYTLSVIFLGLILAKLANASLSCDQFLQKVSGGSILTTEAKQLLLNHTESEMSQGIEPRHQTQFLIHHNSENAELQTDTVVLVFHGLLNSPNDMKSLAQDIHAFGFNVINARLDGHYERKRNELDFIEFKDWIAQLEGYVHLAKQLGKKLVVLGHSTGGLASLQTALEHRVEKIILLAPALKTQTALDALTYTTSFLGLSGWIFDAFQAANSRYNSSHAGVEVDRWGDMLRDTPGDHPESGDYELVRERLSQIPILWFDTAIDRLIDPNYNRIIAQQIPSAIHEEYPKSAKVQHNLIADPKKNTQYRSMIEKIHDFLSK